MKEEIKQILENQFHIMRYLYATETCKIPMFEEGLHKQIEKTLKILTPERKKRFQDRTKDALQKPEKVSFVDKQGKLINPLDKKDVLQKEND